ncbi:MAG: metal ABC transporter solute-binding protein, Zn/Mn family, partial [Candidatus Puniceispirillales bacterium]
MKRHLLPLITILMLGFAPVVAQAKTVAVSMKPLHSLVAMVMEGVGTPELLITGTPHGGHLKPSQMRLISRADRIFMVHGALETLLQKPVAEKEGVIALIDTPGMTILELRLGLDTHDDHAGEGHDDHHDDHAGEGHDDHDDHHDDDHEAHEAHHHVHLDSRDMHIWLDPGNAITMIDRIRDELLAVYPDQAERLNDNAERSRMMLQQLNDQIAADLASIED